MLPRLIATLVVAVALAAPAPASAATVAREGDAIVLRDAPGASLNAVVAPEPAPAGFTGSDNGGLSSNAIAPGSGCTTSTRGWNAECDTTGASAIRLLLDDGDDDVSLHWPNSITVSADFGAGNDHFDVRGAGLGALTVLGGDGNDDLTVEPDGGKTGPVTVDGGAGDDRLSVATRDGVMNGGDGDDTLGEADGVSQTIICGPGDDDALADPVDRVRAGCGPHLTGVRGAKPVLGTYVPRTGAIHLRRGRLSTRVAATLTLTTTGVLLVKKAKRTLPAGALRTTLRAGAKGRRALRRGGRRRVSLLATTGAVGAPHDTVTVVVGGYLVPA
jgi:Ca2+-binding RTX toxin-like protein